MNMVTVSSESPRPDMRGRHKAERMGSGITPNEYCLYKRSIANPQSNDDGRGPGSAELLPDSAALDTPRISLVPETS